MTATNASQRATSREWAGLAVLALPTLLLSIDIFAPLPALPKIDVGYYWWGSVFLLAVPVMVLLLVAGPVLLPEYRSAGAGRLERPMSRPKHGHYPGSPA
jgi:hypothetical protein